MGPRVTASKIPPAVSEACNHLGSGGLNFFALISCLGYSFAHHPCQAHSAECFAAPFMPIALAKYLPSEREGRCISGHAGCGHLRLKCYASFVSAFRGASEKLLRQPWLSLKMQVAATLLCVVFLVWKRNDKRVLLSRQRLCSRQFEFLRHVAVCLDWTLIGWDSRDLLFICVRTFTMNKPATLHHCSNFDRVSLVII